jgi:THO complex subunit 7
VQEYERERDRISNEHDVLRQEISDLKLALEEEQLFRKRKIEYDVIAEKMNQLPTRAEFEESINGLEEEIAGINAEKDSQSKTMDTRQSMFNNLVQQLRNLRLMGKENGSSPSTPPELPQLILPEDGEEGSADRDSNSVAASGSRSGTPSLLNPDARSFQPNSGSSKHLPSHLRQSYTPGISTGPPTPAESTGKEDGEEEDIEMGEVSESSNARLNNNSALGNGGNSRKRSKEDLEEGEASDASSILSDPPDDI